MAKEYEVKTTVSTTWAQIASYRKWEMDESFFHFLFKDGLELILPVSSIVAIFQKR